MEVAALVISIIALLVSIVVACIEYFRDFKIAKIGLEFEFYREIYKEHLIYKIPEARNVMWIDEKRYLRDSDKLIEELNRIRRDSLYFMYNNRPFYEELKTQLQKLEDYIIKAGEKELAIDEQATFLNTVQDSLDGIYRVISNAYCGKAG